MKRALWMAMLATGCFSVPEFTPDTPVLVSYDKTADGTGAIVKGPDFEVDFAGGSGLHFPEKLILDGVDVMGHETNPTCDGQDELGLRFEPIGRISAHGTASIATSELVPLLEGPAIVQVRVDWTMKYEVRCSATRIPAGHSTFTVFPDRRIYRRDVIADTGATEIFPGTCTCGANTDFSIGAYWTFAKADFEYLYLPLPAGRSPLPGDMGGQFTSQAIACVETAGRTVALGWRYVESIDNNANIDITDAVIGFTRNLRDGDTRLASFEEEDSSAIFFESKPCDATLVRASEYRDPSTVMLSINGAPTPPSQRDGIYGGDSGNGSPGIQLSTTKVDLVGPATRPFAVWLRFPKKAVALRATIEPTPRTGAWYVPQRVDDAGSWIVWFPAPLAAGESITIEAR